MYNIDDFVKNVRMHRKKLWLSIYNFSIATDIKYSYLGNVECGIRKPNFKVVFVY